MLTEKQSMKRFLALAGIGLFVLALIATGKDKPLAAATTQNAATVRDEHRAVDRARAAAEAAAATAPAAPTPAKPPAKQDKQPTAAPVTVAETPQAPAKKTDEEVAAWVISSVIAYDHSCETLPQLIMRRIYSGLDVVPLAIFTAATEEASKTYHQIGRANYCKVMKPLVTKILARAP